MAAEGDTTEQAAGRCACLSALLEAALAQCAAPRRRNLALLEGDGAAGHPMCHLLKSRSQSGVWKVDFCILLLSQARLIPSSQRHMSHVMTSVQVREAAFPRNCRDRGI